MTSDGYLVPIIQTGAAHGAIIQTKSGDTHDMKMSSCGRAESRDIAGILWDFRFYQGNAQHDRENTKNQKR